MEESRWGRASDESLDDTNRGGIASECARSLLWTVASVVPHFERTARAVGAGNERATGGARGWHSDPLKRLQLQLQLQFQFPSSHHCWLLMQCPTSCVWQKLQEKKNESHWQSYVQNSHICICFSSRFEEFNVRKVEFVDGVLQWYL